MRRTVPALIVLAALAGAALTGCSASNEASACTVTSGNGSDSVTATGKFGQDPQAKVPSPLNVSKTESSTLIKGTGPRVNKGGAAELSVTIFDGSSGASQPTQTGVFPVVASQISKGLANALACTNQGSRIAVVIPQKDGASMFSVQGTVVAVVDVDKALPNRATGHVRPATPGFPTVILAPNGQPGIVIGDHSEPTKVSSATLKQGDGAKTKKSDTLIVQTQTVEWSDPTSASGSWEQGSPATQTLNDGSALSSQLIGKRVGSQIIVQVPKSKSSDGNASVTVVDILGVLPAAAASAQ
ncbi:peptidylprolyl isomerase [Gryllotalpicola reticulitermitis]|uniref:Peptidylprolyl isomerase n=1 Tax=Gryllotalpicola reticulitermitis TaxID=1184153 RepID=A0ABV8Q8M3_9MICO